MLLQKLALAEISEENPLKLCEEGTSKCMVFTGQSHRRVLGPDPADKGLQGLGPGREGHHSRCPDPPNPGRPNAAQHPGGSPGGGKPHPEADVGGGQGKTLFCFAPCLTHLTIVNIPLFAIPVLLLLPSHGRGYYCG